MSKKHIFVCEKGWQKTREISIDFAKKNILSTVLIKGLVNREVKKMITPYKEIKNIFIPEKIFGPILFGYVLVKLLFPPRDLCIFLTRKKSYRRFSILKKLFTGLKRVDIYNNQ